MIDEPDTLTTVPVTLESPPGPAPLSPPKSPGPPLPSAAGTPLAPFAPVVDWAGAETRPKAMAYRLMYIERIFRCVIFRPISRASPTLLAF